MIRIGPTHRFLGPFRMSECVHSPGGEEIQTHCGEETLVGVVFDLSDVDR